jgi:hypothetical protein
MRNDAGRKKHSVVQPKPTALFMIEIALGIGACYAMAKIADADDESGPLWGAVTFLLCLVGVVMIPFPFLRILGAAVLTFVLMIVAKAVRSR